MSDVVESFLVSKEQVYCTLGKTGRSVFDLACGGLNCCTT